MRVACCHEFQVGGKEHGTLGVSSEVRTCIVVRCCSSFAADLSFVFLQTRRCLRRWELLFGKN